MFTEEQIRSYFAGIELIPHESTQFDVANSERRKRSHIALGGYTRVDATDNGALHVGIRGIPVPHQGYEIPVFIGGQHHELSWQIRHCVSAVTLSSQELVLEGSGLSIHISPSIHLGGATGVFSVTRGCAVPLNTASALIAFSRMNEHAIRELLDLASHKGTARSTFVSGEEEYRYLFPKGSKESPWNTASSNPWPSYYLTRTNGRGAVSPLVHQENSSP